MMCLLVACLVFAQAAPIYGALGYGYSSVSSAATMGLFKNELDAASSADEVPFGPGFTDLTLDYLFVGFLSNPQKVDNVSGNTRALAGYHKSDAPMPWSIFGNFYLDGADIAAYTSETDDGAGNTNKVDARVFNSFDFGVDYHMDIGMGTTGLSLDMVFDDNRTAAANYESETSTETIDAYDKNGSSTLIEASFPFYMETGVLQHYAVLSWEMDGTDSSSGETYGGSAPTDDTWETMGRTTFQLTVILPLD
jgi:hypothetical protein